MRSDTIKRTYFRIGKDVWDVYYGTQRCESISVSGDLVGSCHSDR